MAKNEQKNEQLEEKKVYSDIIARGLAICALLFSGGLGILYYQEVQSFNNSRAALQKNNNDYELQIKKLHDEIATVSTKLQNIDSTPKQIINKGLSEEEITQKLTMLEQRFAAKLNLLTNQYEQLRQQTSANKHFKELLLASVALNIYDLAQNGASFNYETEVLKFLAQGDERAESLVESMLEYTQNKPENKISLINSFNSIYDGLNTIQTQTALDQSDSDTASQTWYDKLWFNFKKMFIRHKLNNAMVFDKNDAVYNLVNAGNLAAALNKMHNQQKYINLQSPELAEWQNKANTYVEFELTAKSLVTHALAAIQAQELQKEQR